MASTQPQQETTQANENGRSEQPYSLPEIPLTDNARTVLSKRYLRRGPDGQPAETEHEMFWRVASHVAAAEDEHGGDAARWSRVFYDMLTDVRFFPNSPTFTGAGTPLGQLAACFVLPIDDDMGRSDAGIFQTLRNAALIQQTGGGNGFAFSRLRPAGALVRSSMGQATGPVGFLRVYDQAFGEIAQGGCLTPDTLVFTEDGLLRLDEIVDSDRPGWQPHQRRVATDAGMRQSRQAYNNGVAPVLRITTDAGIELTGTGNHKLKVMGEDGPEWRAFEDLRPGDSLLVQLGAHRGRPQPLAHPVQQHGNQIMPDLPDVLDDDLAFFLGYMAGDGFVASGEADHRVGVSVAHDSYLMDEMPRLMQRLFGQQINVHRQQKDNDASVIYMIDNRAVKDFLLLNGLGKLPSQVVRVPLAVRKSPKSVVGMFLRGLFEADGSVSHHYPALLSASETLVREVAALLIGLGCPARIFQQPISDDRYGTAPMWVVRVNSFVGLQCWREFIGADERSRFSVCYDFMPDLARESSYSLPNAAYWVEPVLAATQLPQIDRRGRGVNFRATDPKLRKKLLRYTRGDRRLTLSGYQRLQELHPAVAEHGRPLDGLWFITVESVEPTGEALTLDLEVEDNHTYLANGIVSHNSRRGANMAVLNVKHPDIRDFVTCKTNESHITNFNISVGITDAFMEAVRNDDVFELVNPVDGEVWETVPARELFDLIAQQAHFNGEPGVLFLDAANRTNPVPHLYELEATNPCFVGGTRIATQRGLLTIQELAEKEIPLFVATDNRALTDGADQPDGVALRASTPAWKTRENAPVFRLTTKQGYTVVATPDHKFLTPTGYVELQALQRGDKLLLQSGEGAWSEDYALPNQAALRELMGTMAISGDRASGAGVQRADFQALYAGLPTRWSHDLGLVMGVLVGDGWLTEAGNSSLGMTFSSDELLERVHTPLREWFGDGHIHERDSVKQLTYARVPFEFFRSLGVKVVRAPEKQVPDAIWSAPREAVVGFLQGLFSADGSVQVSDAKQDCTVRLASSSQALLQDVQTLLSNFGIISRIYACETGYELVIDQANRDRFADLIGFAESAKQEKLVAFIDGKARRSNREKFVDVVERIEDAGFADVYDLTEPQTHSLIANGFVAHNCGEQWLGPFENCCLGSVNLARHMTDEGQVDWDKLARTVSEATRFLDDVVTANAYVPAVPQLRDAATRVRRIGLGIMGLADMMYRLGVRYGSEAGQEFAGQVMEFVRYHTMRTSVALANERGAFPAIEGSRYDPNDLKWAPPQPLTPYTHDWGRPDLRWDEIVAGIKRVGIRNGAQNTIAPTGTISTVAGCEGYGCEPVFALSYIRHVNDNGQDLQLQYTSPAFERAMRDAGLDDAAIAEVVDQVNREGTCQHVEALPDDLRNTFVVSSDVTPEEHVRMQGALQAFVDNSISKTINMPSTATVQDVKDAYMLAWELGCKGLTVYVTGSRQKVVLETKATKAAKAPQDEAKQAALPLFNEEKKPRPRKLTGQTYRVATPLGATYITVNENGHGQGQPFEVFMHASKAGSDTAAVTEALGRLISYILRLTSPVSPRKRLKEIVRQLSGIGGGRPMGFGPQRVLSLADGIAQMLQQYLDETKVVEGEAEVPAPPPAQEPLPLQNEAPQPPTPTPNAIGDLCPECGRATLVNEEGCRKCYSCGYSEC